MQGDIPRTIIQDAKGKPVLPPDRFANASEVRGYVRQMILADQRRVSYRERVEALFSGFPTIPRSAMAAKGMGWLPRVNFRGLEGAISAMATPLYDLVTEVTHCIDIDLDVEASSTEERDDWEYRIEEAFTWLLFKEWRTGFNYNLLLNQREMLLHGMGAYVWPGKNKWVPRTPRAGQILFPDGTPLDVQQDGKSFALRDFVPGEDVYGFIRNEKSAKSQGWYPDNVWKTLLNATKRNQSIRGTWNSEELQKRYLRGDIGFSSSGQVGLWINWVFVSEYEGGVSLYAIEENIDCGSKDGGYLFKKRFEYDDFPLTLFPIDVGFGDIHSVRGYGMRSKDFYELSNRVTNAMVAQVLISAFPQMSQTQPNVDPDKLKLMRLGALSITPYGLQPSQWNLPPLNNSGIALSDHLRDMLEKNNEGIVGGAPEPRDRETKYSFMLRSHDQSRVSNGMQSIYESNLQQFYNRMYRMLIKTTKGELPYQKMAKAFRDRCMKPMNGKPGVPEKCLKENAIGEIREVTSTGSGSAAIRLQALQLLLNSQIYANAPESKKIQIERDVVAAVMGGVKVDRYARSTTDSDMPNTDESFAAQENNGLVSGGDAVVANGQNNLVHAQIHLQKASEIAQMCMEERIQPEEAVMALHKLLEHAGQHMATQQVQSSPQFKQMADQWRQLAQYMNQKQNEIQSQQGETPPQQQASEDYMLKLQKLQGDEQIKNKKADADIERKFRKDALMGRLSDHNTAVRTMHQNALTMNKIGTSNALTRNKIATNNVVTRNKVAAAPAQ